VTIGERKVGAALVDREVRILVAPPTNGMPPFAVEGECDSMSARKRAITRAKKLVAKDERAEQERVERERTKKLAEEREAAEKAVRDREREEAIKLADELAAKEAAERAAKEKERKDNIAKLEVELTALEQTALDTVHLCEMAQLELIAVPTAENLKKAKAAATALHYLRLAYMKRSAEHKALTEEAKPSWGVLLGIPMLAALAGMYVWRTMLWTKKDGG
jgi:hypothetical protein